jgi:hypothetical protein
VPEAKLLLGDIVFKGSVHLKKGEFLSRLESFLKKRGKPLVDISELLSIPGFGSINLFYEPSSQPLKKGEVVIRDIALGDLFTLSSQAPKLEPLLFSDSVCALLSLRRPAWNDAQTFKETFNKISKQFKSDMGEKWQTNWNILTPLYGKTPRNFNELQKILSQQFDPCVYTVISSGKVNNVEQKCVALIVKEKKEENSQQESNPEAAQRKENDSLEQKRDDKDKKKETKNQFKVARVYWL